jgi:hypothetical protein
LRSINRAIFIIRQSPSGSTLLFVVIVLVVIVVIVIVLVVDGPYPLASDILRSFPRGVFIICGSSSKTGIFVISLSTVCFTIIATTQFAFIDSTLVISTSFAVASSTTIHR